MEKYKLENEEILLKEIVKYKEIKSDIRLNIIGKNIILEKKKGLLKKIYKIIEIIPIKEIELEKQENIIKIKTKNKTITIECYFEEDKKRIIKEIERIKKGRKKLKLDEERLDKIISILSKTEKITTLAVKVAIKIKELKENKE